MSLQQPFKPEGTAVTLKPERTPVAQMWRFVGVGMTVVVMLAAIVVLVAS